MPRPTKRRPRKQRATQTQREQWRALADAARDQRLERSKEAVSDTNAERAGTREHAA